eukprot:CAMPEP_0197317616 /NCGR_PEP_ID=MMETSP0891-20130614/47746_1 /TAXON_ID=44058 ORGANISM="Aureoumbra lagunensis, Strain CCMP1510" /NCGR_SAMPLE_ID=MMETSP0891 /ASSEMBLY_ACC=CAM_ASM_000534 /LENGTH=201 /DNA_ID=CAMNT_0042807683 /DNA_START=177 /DNA_END=779 /DNA_ORIENTATION=+
MTGDGVLNELMTLLGLKEIEAKDVDSFEEEGDEFSDEEDIAEERRRSSLGLGRRESIESNWLVNPPDGIDITRRWRLDDASPKSPKLIRPEMIHSLSGFSPRNAKTKRLESRPGCYWSEPDEKGFRIRGPTYLMDKVKIPVSKPIFHLLDCDLFDLPQPTNHLAPYLNERIHALWKDSALSIQGKQPYTVIIQLQVPGPPW